MTDLEKSPLLENGEDDVTIIENEAPSFSKKKGLVVVGALALSLFAAVSLKSSQRPSATPLLATDEDDTDTVVYVLTREYATYSECEADGVAIMGTFNNFSFITDKCSSYTGYDDTAAVGSVTEEDYYMATCSDGTLTVTSYGTDSTCTTSNGYSQEFSTDSDDVCIVNGDDDEDNIGVTREYVSACDGTVDEAIMAKWKAYKPTHKQELDELVTFLDKKGKMYDQQAKTLGLEPSKRAIKHASKMKKKLAGVKDETLHPAIQRMTISPYTWEWVIRTHEGTIDARQDYLATKPTQKESGNMNPVQGAFKDVMKTISDEKAHKTKMAKSADGLPAKGEEKWFWDDWFGDDNGDDIADNLEDDQDIEDWDDAEYDAMPSITLHAGVSTQVLWVITSVTVDVAVNTDLMYSAGGTIASGSSSDWFSMSVDYTAACTFMFDICDNPGDSISFGFSASVEYAFISGTLSAATIWADPSYDLLGIDFAFSTGFDLLTSGVSLSIDLAFCTTVMPINARDMRAYCNPLSYSGANPKDAPWTLSGWDDDEWGWDARRKLIAPADKA